MQPASPAFPQRLEIIQLLTPLQQTEASLWSQQFPALAFELVRRQSGFYWNNIYEFERWFTTSKDSTLSKEALAIFCKHPNFNAVHGGWGAEGVGGGGWRKTYYSKQACFPNPCILSCLDFEIKARPIGNRFWGEMCIMLLSSLLDSPEVDW